MLGKPRTPKMYQALTTEVTKKWKISKKGRGDVALALFDSPNEIHEPIDLEEEKKVVRKIDYMILPYLAVCYAFFYVDKTTLSYAAIFVSNCPQTRVQFSILTSDTGHSRGPQPCRIPVQLAVINVLLWISGLGHPDQPATPTSSGRSVSRFQHLPLGRAAHAAGVGE